MLKHFKDPWHLDCVCIAESYEVTDGPYANGEMSERPGKLFDKIPLMKEGKVKEAGGRLMAEELSRSY